MPLGDDARVVNASVRDARRACFKERADYIRQAGEVGAQHGLQAIFDLYGPAGIAAIVEYDRLGNEHWGPPTMSRHLQVFIKERGDRL